jgi:hypothetical protein
MRSRAGEREPRYDAEAAAAPNRSSFVSRMACSAPKSMAVAAAGACWAGCGGSMLRAMVGIPLARGSLGELLVARRRRCFVGREAELELVRAALEVAEPTFSVLWLAGPGGIGKSSLLDVVAEEVEQAGGSLAPARSDPGAAAPAHARPLGRYPRS